MSLQRLLAMTRTYLTEGNHYAPLPQSAPPRKRHSNSGTTSPHTGPDTARPSHDAEMDPDIEKRGFLEPSPDSDCPGKKRSRAWLSPRVLSDATIGLSDGLTVPFALTAGLSALGDTRVVIYGGMAELFAGAISMGVGGYLGARSECQAYDAALAETRRCVRQQDGSAGRQVRSALAQFGLSEVTLDCITADLLQNPAGTETFLLRFHHEQTEDAASRIRAYISGMTIALGYFLGGLLPLLPYLFSKDMSMAFWWSCGVMVNVLFLFGWGKMWIIDGEEGMWRRIWNGLQMVLLGGLAAGAAMGCVMMIGGIGEETIIGPS